MRVAVSQPTYLPWMGYFALINNVDAFVFYDDVQFSPQSWQQRNKIKTGNGTQWLTVPIERNELNPEYHNTRVWKVTISDPDDYLLYKDDESGFVGYLNVYWVWDSEDRVWLYNSDTGQVFFWELADGEWLKTEWGHGKVREIDRDLAPPPELYPPYVH